MAIAPIPQPKDFWTSFQKGGSVASDWLSQLMQRRAAQQQMEERQAMLPYNIAASQAGTNYTNRNTQHIGTQEALDERKFGQQLVTDKANMQHLFSGDRLNERKFGQQLITDQANMQHLLSQDTLNDKRFNQELQKYGTDLEHQRLVDQQVPYQLQILKEKRDQAVRFNNPGLALKFSKQLKLAEDAYKAWVMENEQGDKTAVNEEQINSPGMIAPPNEVPQIKTELEQLQNLFNNPNMGNFEDTMAQLFGGPRQEQQGAPPNVPGAAAPEQNLPSGIVPRRTLEGAQAAQEANNTPLPPLQGMTQGQGAPQGISPGRSAEAMMEFAMTGKFPTARGGSSSMQRGLAGQYQAAEDAYAAGNKAKGDTLMKGIENDLNAKDIAARGFFNLSKPQQDEYLGNLKKLGMSTGEAVSHAIKGEDPKKLALEKGITEAQFNDLMSVLPSTGATNTENAKRIGREAENELIADFVTNAEKKYLGKDVAFTGISLKQLDDMLSGTNKPDQENLLAAYILRMDIAANRLKLGAGIAGIQAIREQLGHSFYDLKPKLATYDPEVWAGAQNIANDVLREGTVAYAKAAANPAEYVNNKPKRTTNVSALPKGYQKIISPDGEAHLIPDADVKAAIDAGGYVEQ